MINKKIIFQCVIVFFLLFAPSYSDEPHQRGISIDGTIGNAGKIDLPGPDYKINAEYGRQAGSNLFHSFSKFNIHNGETAAFNGPDSVQNIISRVTGGKESWIDGKLASTITGANLYFLNPAGVMFGPNASLNLSGSFHVSTADYIDFNETERFYSMPSENDVLSVAPPASFGFLDDTPGKIEIKESFLSIPEGKTLSVIGGDIQMHNAALFAQGGQINLESGAAGKISISRDSNFREVNGFLIGDIETSGLDAGHNGGSVFIRGGRFELIGGALDANTSGDGDGGVVDIRATDDIVLDGAGITYGGGINSVTNSSGNSGSVNIESRNFTMKNAGYVTTSTFADGSGGDIHINADNVDMSGESQVWSATSGTGKAGDININAKNSMKASNAYLHASTYLGGGKGGNICINSPELSIDNGSIKSETGYSSDAGEIKINVDSIDISNGAFLSGTTMGQGHGGDISISAAKSIRISGKGALNSGLYVNNLEGSGQSGGIKISCPDLTIKDEGVIQASTSGQGNAGNIQMDIDNINLSGGARILTNTESSGNGGVIHVDADSISISGKGESYAGIYADTYSTGHGGSILISANDLTLNDNGAIRADTHGDGHAGTIEAEIKNLTLSGGGFISSETYGNGGGGNINIIAKESASIFGASDYSSGLYMNAYEGGNGGTIRLSAPVVNLYDGGSIWAITAGQGNAGEIFLDIDTLTVKNGSYIFTQTMEAGDSGSIYINAKKSIFISGYLTGLYADTYEGAGQGGDIAISAPLLSIDNDGAIWAVSNGDSNAGEIYMDVDTLEMRNRAAIRTSSLASGAGGTINIAAHDLIIDTDSNILADTKGSGKAGEIKLETDTLTLTNGAYISSEVYETGSGGNISISAKNAVNISGKGEYSSGLYASAYGDGSGGLINATAHTLTIDNNGVIKADTNGSGNAGEIKLETDTLTLKNGAYISTETYGNGSGGNISISAKNAVNISGKGEYSSGLYASTYGDGRVGTINVAAHDMTIDDNGVIKADTKGSGNAGEIKLETDTLTLKNGAYISTETYETGSGGNISIYAKNAVNISGKGKYSSGFYASTYGDGTGGNINVSTSALMIENEGRIGAITEGSGNADKIKINVGNLIVKDGSGISSSSWGSGKAGDINISADNSVTISGKTENSYSGVYASTHETGASGKITISAPIVVIDKEAGIEAMTQGAENGGSIEISASRLTMEDNASISAKSTDIGAGGDIVLHVSDMRIKESYITTDAENAGGGRITMDASGALYLFNSSITTNVESGENKGGDIKIGNPDTGEGPELVALNNGVIQANADIGDGGAVFIVTDNYLKSLGSIVEATSKRGNQGTVKIQAPEIDVSSSLTVLPVSFLDATRWIETPCEARTREKMSHFIIKGETITSSPFDELLPTPAMW